MAVSKASTRLARNHAKAGVKADATLRMSKPPSRERPRREPKRKRGRLTAAPLATHGTRILVVMMVFLVVVVHPATAIGGRWPAAARGRHPPHGSVGDHCFSGDEQAGDGR